MKTMTSTTKKILAIVLFGFALLLFVTLSIVVGKPMVTFASQPEIFRKFMEEKGILGILLFIGMLIVQVVVALIPGGPFEVAAGYAFGVVKGTIICSLGITIGSMIVFALVRKFGRSFIELFFSKEKIDSVKVFNSNDKSIMLFFLLMLIPGAPKDLLSYLAGLSTMRVDTWFLITLVGRLPFILLSVMSGSALNDKKYVVFGIVMMVIIALYTAGIILYRSKNKAK